MPLNKPELRKPQRQPWHPHSSVLKRRELLIGALGVASATWMVSCGGGGGGGSDTASTGTTTATSSSPSTTTDDLSCVLSPEVTEGPYFVDEKLNRYDLTADTTETSVLNGLPLYLQIGVYSVNGSTCTPLSGVQIDIWHARSSGLYSDETSLNTAGQTFLRGYQVTDSGGSVTFKTIYPGWYRGRTVHIHIKARRYDSSGNKTSEATTQLFFSDAVTDLVFANLPYSSRGARDTRNAADDIYDGQTSLLLDLSRTDDGTGYNGVFTLGLQVS